jgi:predicted dehydrogenase
MKKNKFFVIGLGKRGSTYIKLLEQNPRIDIVGVCDNDVKRNNNSNIGIKFFKDYRKILSDVDFDCAVICTPPNTHYDIASYMIKNGKNIIVEKPFVFKPEQAKKIIEDARKKDLVCLVGYHLRYNEYILKIKDILLSNEIGEVFMVKARQAHNWGYKKPFSWSVKKKVSGGGVIMDNASHYLDLLSNIFGKISNVSAVVSNSLFGYEVEDNAILIFKVDKNIIGSIEVSWGDNSGRNNGLCIWGTKGVLEYTENNKGSFLKKTVYESIKNDDWNIYDEKYFYMPKGIELISKNNKLENSKYKSDILSFFFNLIDNKRDLKDYYKNNNDAHIVKLLNDIYRKNEI